MDLRIVGKDTTVAAPIEQRMNESRDSNGVYFNRVMGVLLTHAAYQRRGTVGTGGVTAKKRALALAIVSNPSAYVFPFAARISVEPPTDSYTTMHDVPASVIQPLIEEKFEEYAPDVAQ